VLLLLAAAGVIADPDVAHYTRQAGDEFLLLASDGLWGVLSNQVWHYDIIAAAMLTCGSNTSSSTRIKVAAAHNAAQPHLHPACIAVLLP
jgi:serine/threonine protein phosphatase PrpC